MGAASGKTLRRWARRALILGASVLLVGAVAYRALDRPARIDSYRPIDDRTLVLVAVDPRRGHT